MKIKIRHVVLVAFQVMVLSYAWKMRARAESMRLVANEAIAAAKLSSTTNEALLKEQTRIVDTAVYWQAAYQAMRASYDACATNTLRAARLALED